MATKITELTELTCDVCRTVVQSFANLVKVMVGYSGVDSNGLTFTTEYLPSYGHDTKDICLSCVRAAMQQFLRENK